MAVLPSACPLDCPDSCSLDVTVEADRVVHIAGSTRNPLTGGFLCQKVRRFDRELYGEHRILHPARRTGPKGGGHFERISWDEAFDIIVTKTRSLLERHGGEAILPLSYGGSNGLLTQDTTDARLFRRLGASRLDRTVCAAPSTRAAAGLYGRMPGVAFEDFVHARTLLFWGVNPSATGIHQLPKIQEARRRGARLAVVDPRRIPLARRADLHLAPRPGTDLPLALALVRWIFEEGLEDREFLARHAEQVDELRARADPWTIRRAARVCEVPEADIEDLARMWVEGEPALLRCGWGAERNRNGGSAIAAILTLPAVAGKFGVRGGGYTLSNAGAWRFDPSSAIRAPEAATRRINMNLVGRELLERQNPPIELLFVYNCNPLSTLPRQEAVRAGLAREDLFTVVFDPVHTDTARFADLLLPATTFLEHRELRAGYGAYVLQDARPVIAPRGESRPNYEVFGELCRRLGLAREGDPETASEIVAELLASDSSLPAPAPGECVPPVGGSRPIAFVDVFPNTLDRKIHLVPDALDREAPEGLYHYRADPATTEAPLALVSPALRNFISSTFGALLERQVAVAIHPDDAALRDIRDGDRVRIHNDFGELECLARISEEVRAGVLFLPKGLWSHHTLTGATANAISPDTLTDLAGGACFNDARVQLSRVGS